TKASAEAVPFIVDILIGALTVSLCSGGLILLKAPGVNTIGAVAAKAASVACTQGSVFFITRVGSYQVALGVVAVFGDNIDNAVHRIAAPQGASRPANDLNAVYIFHH